MTNQSLISNETFVELIDKANKWDVSSLNDDEIFDMCYFTDDIYNDSNKTQSIQKLLKITNELEFRDLCEGIHHEAERRAHIQMRIASKNSLYC